MEMHQYVSKDARNLLKADQSKGDVVYYGARISEYVIDCSQKKTIKNPFENCVECQVVTWYPTTSAHQNKGIPETVYQNIYGMRNVEDPYLLVYPTTTISFTLLTSGSIVLEEPSIIESFGEMTTTSIEKALNEIRKGVQKIHSVPIQLRVLSVGNMTKEDIVHMYVK